MIDLKKTFTSWEELPLFLSAEQVAGILGVSKANAYSIFHSKNFPVLTVGERRMVCPRDAFIKWVNKNISDENGLFSAKG